MTERQIEHSLEIYRHICYRIQMCDNDRDIVYGLQCAFDLSNSQAENYLLRFDNARGKLEEFIGKTQNRS